MEESFKGLYRYEEVMLILGIILFAILCVGLIYYIIKKEDIKKLLFFFIVAFVMIGYPSIQEIQIENDKIALIKYTNKVIANPEDKEAREELSQVADKLEKRATTVEDFKVLSETHLLLGNSDKVVSLTNDGISRGAYATDEKPVTEDAKDSPQSTPESPAASPTGIQSLKNIQQVAILQKNLQENPATMEDTTAVQEQLKKVIWTNPKTEVFLNRQIMQKHVQN